VRVIGKMANNMERELATKRMERSRNKVSGKTVNFRRHDHLNLVVLFYNLKI